MEKKLLRLLLAEDSNTDAELIIKALEVYGYKIDCVRVTSTEALESHLAAGSFQMVLCDHSGTGVDALRALSILQKLGRDIPLIVVSSPLGESVVADVMRQGAADCIPKSDLSRLGPAVARDLKAAENRRQKQVIDGFSISQTKVLEMILAGAALKSVLEFIAKRTEELCGDGIFCSIMLADPANTHLRLAAGPTLPETYSQALGEIPIRPGMGSCGTAAATGVPVIVGDISSHPDWRPLRKVALEHGLRSCWSIPIFSNNHRVLGTMSIYRPVSREPEPDEVRWVEAATKLAAIAIESGTAAGKLHESETLLRIASTLTHIGGWTLEFPELRITWSDELCAIHEVPPGTVPDLKTALDFYPPGFRVKIQETFEKCCVDGTAFDVEAEFITAGGKKLWVRSIGECVRDLDGNIIRIQGALQDITAKKRAQLEARELESIRRKAEETTRANELRYLKQRNALIALTKEALPAGFELAAAFQSITVATARTLGVARVGIWRFSTARDSIECVDQFNLPAGTHSAGAVVIAADHPAYFMGLSEMELIAADEAHADPSTREFFENYLNPTGITSMLDVPVRSQDAVDYVLCCEHIGPPRQWTPDEKTFAVAVANLISLAVESSERALADQEVTRSHERFQSVAAATNDTVWDWNLETNAFWWDDGHANLFGWSSDSAGETIDAWTGQIHSDDRQRVVDSVDAAVRAGNVHWSSEYRFVSTDGSVSNVLARGQLIFDTEGKAIRMVGGMTDLTASRRAETELLRSHRALRMLSSCNEMLIRTSDEKSLLAEACRLAVEIGGYRMAWAGYATDDEHHRVRPMAHAGAELGYLDEVEITWAGDHSSGVGPVGQSIRSGKPVVFEDVIGNPAFYYWLAPATKRGYRSVVCLPLHDEQRVFGVLCLYGSEPHPAGQDELKLLQEMANDVAFGITNSRERESRQRTQEVIIKVAQAVSTGTGLEFFDLLTLNMVEAMAAYGGMIGQLDPLTNTIETISYVLSGELQENVTYDLAGTPCENVMEGDICVFEQNLQELFPDDHLLAVLGIEAYVGIPLFRQDGGVAGIMAVFFSARLWEIALVKSMLRIFAARAASEMDRQQADSRIREQASLLDKARDAILVRDLDHRITYWNKSAERLYGWSAEEAIGRSVLDLIYRDRVNFMKAQTQMLAYDEWQGEMVQVSKEGRDLMVDGRWTLVRGEKGRPDCVFVLNTDISEHRKLEQQFLRAQRIESIGTLAGGIAHDLNNMLAPISMSVELLKMRVTDPRANELLDTIAGSAKRGSDMVSQVLSFARGMEGRRMEVYPRQLIREIENILRDTMLRKIELVVRTDRSLWKVHGDPTQLHQVILNLCVNARDAIHGEGKITISARNIEIDAAFAAINLEAKEGPHVCIQVEDTGEGISPALMDKIFDPFFTTKSVGKGTGLGLSTSLAIVKSHGGFIRTTSRPGQGTRFRVFLPAIPGQSVNPQSPANVEMPVGNGELVLIVDDEASIRRITQETLEAFGYRTLLAANGEEAVASYSRHLTAIDVVLTDMMMPVMDGAATIEHLKEINPSVQIIATSGITTNFELALGAGKGTKHFLPKPYTAESLLTCLQGVLSVSVKER